MTDWNETFYRANEVETKHVKDIITKYQQVSGQLVSFSKSEVIFSKKVQPSTKATIHQILPMPIVDHFSKYLGQPIIMGRAKKQTFSYIQDKVWKKLKGWKEKNLSFAGRGTLIKAVAQAIPTYLMSNYLLPKGLCQQIESMTSRFWWGSNVDKRKIHWVNWKKTCKKKEEGGMGFRDISAFNEALLAKQGWRIMTEPDSLLAKVLKSKYFPQCHFLKAKKGHKASYSWQSINKASWILKRGCFWLLGNGNDINIWEDRWLHPQGQQATWTNKPANSSLEAVKDIINPATNNWDRHITAQTFIPMEAEEIIQTPIPSPMEKDIISWQGTNDGIYTIKSGYNAQLEWEYNSSNSGQTSTNGKEALAWKNLWKAKVPPKQIHLIWRILHNDIPIKPNLISKGINCDSLCPRCYEATESMDHAFLHCEWVRQIWFSSPLTINTSQILNQSFGDWVFYMLTNSNTECIQQILSITYNIWWTRNQKAFQNKNTPVLEALDKALTSIHEFLHHSTAAQPTPSSRTALADRNNNRWTPPHENFLKLNVDAHLHDDGRWGYGMVLRRMDGRAVGAVTKVIKGSDDATLAEAVGILEAVKWLKTHGYQRVIVESDAEIVIQAVIRKKFPRTNWGTVACRISRDLEESSQISVGWVKRNGNQAAHGLARLAISDPDRFWPNNFPPCILAHILSDMEGVICDPSL